MSIIIVVGMKIASLSDLGTQATCKANEFIGINEKLASVCIKSFDTGHERHKQCIFAHAYRPHLLMGHVLPAHAHNCMA